MAPTLGKRKRVSRAELEQPSRSPTPDSGSGDSGGEHLQAIFQRAFEATFKPLAVEPKRPKIEEAQIEDDDDEEEEEEEEEEESDWSGISDTEQDDIEIIEYKDTQTSHDDAARAAKKAFMSSKPPSSSSTPTQTLASTRTKKPKDDADLTETTNLKNDMALQKLLRESHLLSASSSGTSTPTALTATGIARHRSTDLHLQALGAKTSVFTQTKMPMAQRKHMASKAARTEEKRRADAREAGIVLEREKRVVKVRERRERGVGGPSIGRFKGGTLSLSKRDVRSITGGGAAKGKGKSASAKKGEAVRGIKKSI
ncbi:pre-rRNA processing and 40S ribosomal subunit assembly [Coniothyrium glycines]